LKQNNIVKFKKLNSKALTKKGYALYNEGLCFYRQDKDSIALKKFLHAEDLGYESSDMFSSMARIYGAEGQFDKVKEYARKAIDIDSEYGYPYFMLGGAYYEEGDYEQTLKNYLLAEEKGCTGSFHGDEF
jgi:tetratricopeptide (TPR) repeat protein